jgi:ribosomal protein S8
LNKRKINTLISRINNINYNNKITTINGIKTPGLYIKLNDVEYKKENYSIIKLLENLGYVKNVKITLNTILFELSINSLLKLKLKQISTSGRRVYISNKQIISLSNTRIKTSLQLNQSKIGVNYLYTKTQPVKGSTFLIRTSNGIMTLNSAILKNLGGELLLRINYE